MAMSDKGAHHMQIRRRLSAVLAMLPWWSAQASPVRRLPVIVPFPIAEKGRSLVIDIDVREHRVYWLTLRLSFDPNDRVQREKVRTLAGDHGRDSQGNLITPGVKIPLALTIASLSTSSPTLEKEIREEEMYAVGADHYTKKVDTVELKPGKYRVSVVTLAASPELSGVPVALGIGFDRTSAPISGGN